MITRREAVRLLGSASAGAWIAAVHAGASLAIARKAFAASGADDSAPALAPGAPNSPERLALIEAFRKKSEGLEEKFEARTFAGDWKMPYRLFRPAESSGKAPLVVYLHGSGGLGDDNLKQMGLGNIFGTRVWALPENQKRFPCYILVPQTDRGWIRYDPELFAKGEAKMMAGLGEGNRLALQIIDALRKEFAIDDRRIYVTGQSMGGAGVWNMTAHRQKFFAAAVPCCGSESLDDAAQSADTPVWAFHGGNDQTVPVAASRDRIAVLRKAGAHPIYTEYAGVDHNSWQWAYTEPALVDWLFARRRA